MTDATDAAFSTAIAQAGAGALEDIAQATSTPEPASTPAATAEPAAPVATEASPETPAAPASATTEIKWNGQTFQLTPEQMVGLAQKGFDYTAKTQTLAEEKKSFEAERSQIETERQQLAAFLQDPARVGAYYQQLQAKAGAVPQALGTNPEDIPTASQVQAVLDQRLKALETQTQSQIDQRVLAERQKLETDRYTAEYNTALKSAIKTAMGAHPALAKVKGMDQLLTTDVWDKIQEDAQVNGASSLPGPEDIEGLVSAAAAARSEVFKGLVLSQATEAQVEKAKLTSQGLEPPGGGGVAPAPARPHKLGSDDLRNQAIADVEALMRK
jgi:hypothetical protein